MTTTRTCILGVDPGLSGALALYQPALETEAGHPHSIVDIIDTPVHEIEGKKFLDYYALGAWLDVHAPLVRLAVIEEVGAAPGAGVTGMFRFGETYGAVKGALGAHMIPMRLVRPALWKPFMKLSRDKEASRKAASALFPREGQERWPRKADNDRAEALLLAIYATEVGW